MSILFAPASGERRISWEQTRLHRKSMQLWYWQRSPGSAFTGTLQFIRLLVILRYFGWHFCLCFLSQRLLTTTATQKQGESVEHDHGYEQQEVDGGNALDLETPIEQNSQQHAAENGEEDQ